MENKLSRDNTTSIYTDGSPMDYAEEVGVYSHDVDISLSPCTKLSQHLPSASTSYKEGNWSST